MCTVSSSIISTGVHCSFKETRNSKEVLLKANTNISQTLKYSIKEEEVFLIGSCLFCIMQFGFDMLHKSMRAPLALPFALFLMS